MLRYLRVHRLVLHRDISNGNILYLPDDATAAADVSSDETQNKEVPLCFIKYLLGERYV